MRNCNTKGLQTTWKVLIIYAIRNNTELLRHSVQESENVKQEIKKSL